LFSSRFFRAYPASIKYPIMGIEKGKGGFAPCAVFQAKLKGLCYYKNGKL
jgi:hypothetical protein